MQTPFDDPVMKTPAAKGDESGIYDNLEGGMSETPGQGGIPTHGAQSDITGTPPGWQDPSTFEANRTWPASSGKT